MRGLFKDRLPRLAVYSYYKKIKSLYNLAEKENGKPDILYAHFTFPSGYIAYRLSKKKKIPYVVDEHYSILLQKELHPYINKILRLTVENANEFICVSEILRLAVQRHTKTNKSIRVIPNLIDDRFLYYPPPGKNVFKFFSAGNLIRNKRFDLLIEAFCKAFTSGENVALCIAGAGKEYEKLDQIIRKEKRQHQIKLLGRLCREEMLEQYKSCHCFAMPSIYETFGIVYREAMAVGRPIISAKNGGIEECWEDAFGILTEINDVNGFAEAIQHVYSNYGQFNTEYISKRCIQFYSSDSVSEQINKVLLKAIHYTQNNKF